MMLQELKKAMAMLLVMTMLVSFAGCAGTNGPEPSADPTDPAVTCGAESTAPSDTGDTIHDTVPDALTQTVQQRLDGFREGWVDVFAAQYGAFATIDDTAELNAVLDAIRGMGRDVALDNAYDDAFFAQYRLVLITRQSNSGSVRYETATAYNGELITVTLTAQMPEVGTTDMADWLILVPLARDAYPEGVQIDLLTSDGLREPGDGTGAPGQN